MAIYDLGTASLAANGEVTGVGTRWKAPLTLIRVGATIVFKTEPVQIYTISEIISDTRINVYNPNSETVPAGTGYAILAHDGITVQGLAQDVAETLRYYQSRETEVATAVDVFKDFDQDKFSSDVNQVNTQYGEIVSIGAQVANDAAQVSSDKDSAAASASSASSDKDAAAASAQEAADYAASLDTQNLLRKDLALSDLTDKTLARKNLNVYSINESDKITSFISSERFRSSSSSDQEALQLAINFARDNGLSVKLSPSINYVVSSINVSCPLVGPGKVSRLSGTSSTLVVMSSGGSLKNVLVDGTRTSGSDAYTNISITGLSGIIIDGVNSISAGGHSIEIRDTPVRLGNTIKNCKITGTRVGYGINVRNGGAEIIESIEVSDCVGGGVVFSNSEFKYSGASINRVHAYRNGGNGITTQFLTNSTTPSMSNVSITNCVAHNNVMNGIVCQSSDSVVSNNITYLNGTTTSHQGMLYNARRITSTGNISHDNAGVGFDFGDCRDSVSSGDISRDNGWHGFEINACENFSLSGFFCGGNFKGKPQGSLQAGVIVHKGTGGYPFTGASKGVSVTGGTITGGDGQIYGIMIDGSSSDVVATSVSCKNSGLIDDIFTLSRMVTIKNNITRWDPLNDARVTAASTIEVPSCCDSVQVNGTTSISTINIANSGAFIRDRYLRIVNINTGSLALIPGGNINISENKVIGSGYSVVLWSKGNGAWYVQY